MRYHPAMHQMKNYISVILFAVLVTGCSKEKQTGHSDDPDCISSNASPGSEIISGRYIVSYDPQTIQTGRLSPGGLTDLSQTILERNHVVSTRERIDFGGETGGFIMDLSPAEADIIRRDAAVKIVEPDRVIALNTCFTVVEPRLLTWNINRVGYGDGTGKTAWIIDTGIDTDHPDLNVDVAKSKSFLSGITSVDDQNGHGTHVAGIIGAKNNTFGVLGVASGATLVSLRVLNGEGVGSLSAVVQALAHVQANGRAGDVVNLSLGEELTSPTLNQQVQNTAAKGIFVSMAAGNDGDMANKFSPGNTNGLNIYTVSAIDSLDRFAGFSNYGNDVVDFAAPGVRILSAFTNGRYAVMSGTSMAAPHVAGLLLLKGGQISRSGFALSDPDNDPDPIAHY